MMLRKTFMQIALIIVMLIILASCSGGGAISPIAPSSIEKAHSDEQSVRIPKEISDGATMPIIFGMYQVELDKEVLSGSVYPVRSAGAIGDSFHVDITPFLSVDPCSDCIVIKSIGLSEEGFVELTFRTKHPFGPENRYDLHVFDMRGIIVTADNTKQFNRIRIDMDGNGTQETPARGNVDLVVNADGYTSYYDSVVEGYTGHIFDSTICPFKNMWMNPATESPDSNYNPSVASEYGFTDLQNPTGHNVFPMGGGFDNPLSETTYLLDLSETTHLNFLLILEASYGHTTRRITRKEPRYFLPEFHRKDAWMVQVEIIENDLIANASSSSAKIQLSVMDWQAGFTSSGGWDYYTSDLNQIKYQSDVNMIEMDVPGILDQPKVLRLSDLESGDGSYDTPYTWIIDIQNELSAGEGIYYGMFAVRDDLVSSSSAPLGVSGTAQNPVRVFDISTYQAFKLEVEFTNEPPVAHVLVDPNPVRVCSDVTISVGPNCMDPDGQIVRYEYDFHYDGTEFVADVIQNEGDLDFGWEINIGFDETEAGNRTIAQRVTDNLGSDNFDSVILQVRPNQSPVAQLINDTPDDTATVCDTVEFQPGTGCNDPDGVIIRYEYDFDYDGVTFNPEIIQNTGSPNFGQPVLKQFANTGPGAIEYTVALRVTDDGCPELTNIDTNEILIVTFSGEILFEDFETTTAGSVPSGWGITGHTGGAYYLTSLGNGCTNTDWKWGVTDNASLCEGTFSRFLNESGNNHAGSDPLDCYQNRANIVYSPEFTVPPEGAVVTIRHRYEFTYGTHPNGMVYVDGGRAVLSVNNPGEVTWSDFCNHGTGYNYNNTPIRPLARISGPDFRNIASGMWTVENHPLRGMQAHAGSSSGWVTSTYSIPATYGCERVRLGFLFASDDLLAGYYGDGGPVEYLHNCSQYLSPPPPSGIAVYPNYGWRINWVGIEAN